MGIAVESWSSAVTESLFGLWARFMAFLPALLGAIIIFLIGWVVAIAVGKIVTRMLEVLHVNQGMERVGLKKGLTKSGVRIDLSLFIGELSKWFLIIVFLMAATDVLGLGQITKFLNEVLVYLPSIIVAAIILVIAVLLANFVYRLVQDSMRATGVISANAIAALAKWSILIFAVLAALVQLKVAEGMIMIVFQGIIAMLAIAGGLSFGLGGRDAAEDVIEKVQKELKGK